MTSHRATLPTPLIATVVALGALTTLPISSLADPSTALAASAEPRALVMPRATLPTGPEPDGATAGGAGPNPFAGKAVAPIAAAAGQTLTAPVTVNAGTTADALTVTQTGAGRAISGAVTNGSNGLSAVKGITNGSGSGVNGVNSGTKGQSGKFEITNASSAQPSLLVTTAGSGSAVQAIAKGEGSDAPAVLGQHLAADGYGVGVQGDGSYIGLRGSGTYGVVGAATADSGIGVNGTSYRGSGVSGYASSGVGVSARSDNYRALSAYSSGGYGLYAESGASYAGYFAGPVYATGAVTAASYGYTSDRDQKQDFTAVDSADVLTRIAAMPITAWGYKAKPAERHIGPMAQDFHAAFGLGADERHIDVVDGIGVSLAAIKELQRQLVERDARIDRLEAQLQARIVALEQGAVTASVAVTAAAR